MADYDDGLEMGVPAAYYDTWNRHNSIAFTNYKGLRNAPGENNCFLNSAVQVFWHLDVFRRSYRRLEGHSCMGNSCIFCALKAIFTQFQYSDQSSLQPDTLRKALAETFVDQHRYQLGHMDDAAECFENILRRLHLHVATEHNEDTCTAAHCISHQKFAMTVFDQVVCPCGAKTDPLRFHELVHYVSASALVSQAKQMQETGDVLHPDRFGLLLRNAAAMGDIRNCPSSCGKRVQMRRTLLNLPDVVSIGLIWDSERPSGGLVTDVIRSLGTTILLQDVFHSVMTEDGSRLPKLNLSAVVCYYGKHYSTFVFNTKMKVWIYFDDATVREIGPRWEDVVEKCVRSRYQPLLLLYTNPYPTLLAVQSAPQKTTMHPGYKFSAQVSPDGPKQKRDPRAAFAQQRAAAGRRAVTPGPETSGRIETAEPRRAITPGPEHYNSEPERDGATRGSIQHGRHNSFLVAMSDRPDHRQENQPMIGDYVYSNGAIQPSFNVQGSVYDSQSVVSNNSDPNYQRYTGVGNGVAPPLGVVVPNNDMQRKESFKKGNKAHGDIIRYTVDQQRLPTSADQPLQQRRASRGKHVRSRSQSCEDTLSVSSETNPHVTKTKPRSGAYNMENGKAVHGPVQSGLATLPRKKSDQRNIKTPSPTVVLDSSDQSHERQGSASSTGSVVLNPKYPSNSSRGEYMDQKHFIRKPETGAYQGDYPAGGGNQHWRQVSASSQSSQSTLTPANADTGYPGVSHSHQSSCSSQVSSSRTPRVTLPGGAPPPSNTPDPALDQDYATYNMRHMTEKILCKQRVQRQASSASSMSVRSNTSSSSIESDYMQKPKSKAGKDSLSVEIPYDNLSLESQKDSGYGSSDRNSSSSTGSITMDPFSQYFISRSMIPPKSVNDYSFMQNFTESFKESLANMEKQDSVDSAYEPIEFKGQPPNAYTVNYVQQQQHLSQKATTQSRLSNQNLPSRNINEQNENNRNTYAGHKISKSPPKQSPSSSNRKGAVSVTDNTNVYKIPAPKEIKNAKPSMMPPSQHDVPVPQEKDLINFKSGIQVQDILPGYSEVANQGSEEFYNLCHKAEEMMDRCILAETNVDFSSAINCCNSAVSYLKQAMQLPGVSQQSYVFAQRKHNSCVMKHRSLQKNAPSNLEGNVFSASSETLNSSSANRSSMTSTDSDGSQRDFIQLDGQGKTKTDVFKDKLQNLYKQGVSQQDRGRQGRQPGAKPPPPQRGVSIGSRSIPVKQSNPTCQNSPITGNVNINTNVQRTENLLNSGHLRTNPMNSNTVKSKSAIPDRGVGTPCVSGSSHDSELYQTYLNRQRALAAGARSSGQSSSGTSTPTSSLDGSDGSREMPGSSYVSKSYSKAEIRHILQQNMMHRQQPVGAVPVRVPHQQSPPPAYPGGQHVRPAPPTQDTLVRDNPSSAGITARPGQPPVVKPQIACKPVISGYRPKSVHPTVNSSRSCMPPGDCLNNGSRTIERCSSQPDNLFQQHQRACSSEHTYLIQNSTLGRDKNSWSTYSSQPDLSSSGLEEECPNFPPPASLSAPSTPAHSSENLSQPDCKPSVKDIASRFEASMGQAQVGRYTPDMPHRQRSKSESSSGPKPVLKQKRQRKKPKARAARKSVTFSDSIALIAAAEEGLPPGPAPPPYEEAVSSRGQDRMGWEDTDTYYGYDSDDDIVKVVPAGYHDEDYCDKDSCASSESPVEVSEIMCSLCRKKGAEPGVPYCSNCHFYMSRFQPNR